MSDYIFSTKKQPTDYLGSLIQGIYKDSPPKVYEFHGKWGSLIVTQQHYNGFLPYENEKHLMIVIGGPVLYFRDNAFLIEEDSSTGTEAIYNRWVLDRSIQWDEDLSGPFTVLLVDKQDKLLKVVTDLMAFIPVYSCQKAGELYLGSHVDVLASAADERNLIDQVSLADFVLNDAVTYPYTVYQKLRQLAPSSETVFNLTSVAPKVTSYWDPKEENPYSEVCEAAEVLREGISSYCNRVTANMTKVAQFISAGEDSRALSGLLPQRLQRDAFIFLDHMNREGKIAKNVASIYGANFIAGFREKTHYLDMLPEASNLVGSGHQYTHAHSLGFNEKYNLCEYTAVFGGYLSDTLLKGYHIKKFKGYGKLPFLPQISRKNYSVSGLKFGKAASFFKNLDKVKTRQEKRAHKLAHIRTLTYREWFNYYPCSMLRSMPNLYSTRRMFKSYEPFMCKEAVKVGAVVPDSWKLNRRLFNTAMKPYLKPSKWLLHSDGRLPYFGWWTNMPIQFVIWLYRLITKRIGIIRGNQGPWGDWDAIFKHDAWQSFVKDFGCYADKIEFLKNGVDIEKLLLSKQLSKVQKINLLQVLYAFRSNDQR